MLEVFLGNWNSLRLDRMLKSEAILSALLPILPSATGPITWSFHDRAEFRD